MTSRFKVFHNPCELLRRKLNVILVRPENSGNVGSAARAIKNMGVNGDLIIVGDRQIVDAQTARMAKHAYDRIESARFVRSLSEAKCLFPVNTHFLASTARVGSPKRPHPTQVRQAVEEEIDRLKNKEIQSVAFVFGPESDGLSNEEVALCDRVVSIPASPEYCSINLSQAVLIFCYEANEALNQAHPSLLSMGTGQRDRLIQNLISIAEEAGFILPEDPHKMRPVLEGIFSRLPKYIPEVRTLHGLLDQVRRSLKKGAPDVRGRYRREWEKLNVEC